jgi:hypothetical protein
MESNEICILWLKYLRESNFKKEHGDEAYQAYIKRIKAHSEALSLTPFPSVRKISQIIEPLIDQAHSETITDGDTSFENFKKKLIRDIKTQEQTSLLLHIHCPGIPPRGGTKNILEKVRDLLKKKLTEVKDVREFYLTWTEPGERIVPELELYLKLYRGQKRGLKIKELWDVALTLAEKIKRKRLSKENDVYLEESQISRSIGYAKKILRNVENGHFPGKYKHL